MNINSAFPSQFLKASDLGDKTPVVEIARVAIEPVGQNKEMKPVVYFVGKDKGMVLNKTNARKIAELTGSSDTEDWTGCRIRLYATETEFAGDMVECIRVKAAGNGPAKQKREPEPVVVAEPDDDDPPF